MHLLAIASILYVIYQLIKESLQPTIPATNWENKELIEKDRSRGLSEKEILKNVERGRYIIQVRYPEPHRELDGKKRIVIENCELHRKDIEQYGAYQAQKWVEQGKYNLNEAELEITHLQYERQHLHLLTLSSSYNRDKDKNRIAEIDRILATKHWDCRNTEAVQQWQKAHNANNAG